MRAIKGRTDNEAQVLKSRGGEKGGKSETGSKAQKTQEVEREDETIKIKRNREDNRHGREQELG